MIVTEYGLAHWISQSLNLDVNDLPKQRPEHINKEAFDALRSKILKDFIYWNKDQMKPEQSVVNLFNSQLQSDRKRIYRSNERKPTINI